MSRPAPAFLQDYVTVNQRIVAFYSQYPNGRIITEVLRFEYEPPFAIVQAKVFRSKDDIEPASTGHASGTDTKSNLETTETSAVGRALALLGFEVKRGIASRDEVKSARRVESHLQAVPSSENSAAKTMADLITPKQLVAVRALAHSQRVNAEELCVMQMGCRPEELSRRAASAFIDYLKSPECAAQINEESEQATAEMVVNRAKALNRAGCVERDYDGFNIKTPGLNQQTFRVWRDGENQIKCNCPSFTEQTASNPQFRCEHIFAVKFHLSPPESEASEAGV